MGPTPPRMPGSWFFLMSVSHSVTAYWITLSTPRRLGSVAEERQRDLRRKTLLVCFSNIMIYSQKVTNYWTLNICLGQLDIWRESLGWQHYLSSNQGVQFGRVVCVSTRVCSRASLASAQNSLTGPGRSESLQTFPVKQNNEYSVGLDNYFLIKYTWLLQLSLW